MKSLRVTSILLFACACLLGACGGGGGGGTAPATPLPLTHVVTGVQGVADNASGVSTSLNAIQILFAREMDPVTTAAAFQIVPAVARRINVSGKILTCSFDAPFLAGTLYTVRVATTARDTEGNLLEQEYTLRFTTAGASGGPATVGDLSVVGTSFQNLELRFSAPSGGADTVAAYLIRYATGNISSALFDAKQGVYDLPSAVTIPSPAAAGTLVSVSVPTALLSEASPGDTLRFALKSRGEGGQWSELSNLAVTVRPWYLDLRFTPRDQEGISRLLRLGAQDGAGDATDSFDSLSAPPLPGELRGVFTLSGRTEELQTDIRAPFSGATGQSRSWIVALSGNPSQSMHLEFPAFNSTTPLYSFRIAGIEAYEVTLTGQSLDFSLDGSGRRSLTLTVTN